MLIANAYVQRKAKLCAFCAITCEANAQKARNFACPVEARIFAPERTATPC